MSNANPFRDLPASQQPTRRSIVWSALIACATIVTILVTPVLLNYAAQGNPVTHAQPIKKFEKPVRYVDSMIPQDDFEDDPATGPRGDSAPQPSQAPAIVATTD